MDELIPRTTVDEVVGHRDAAVAAYARASFHLEQAAEDMKAAQESVKAATAGHTLNHYSYPHAPEIEAFDAAQVLDPEQFLRVAERLTDIRVWASLIERTELDHLMDKEAKDELRGQMAYVPEVVDRESGKVINGDEIARGLPPVTVETIQSTLQGFAQDSGMIFRRGLANAFSELDRRFRSHDGFKIGSRVILSSAFCAWGWWNHYRNHRDTLTDIERVFLVLDGKGPRAAYAGIVGAIEAERKGDSGARQSEHGGDYFRVRIFKNGNAHLWFTRDDLVRKANKLLAEHYGQVVADGKDRPEEYDHVSDRAVGQAKDFGFYPTPDAVAERIADQFYGLPDNARILEPSAGTGQLARRVKATDVVEIQPHLASDLEAAGFRTRCADFLALEPEPVYDAVAMNPPFDWQRDIDHVWHAWHFLKPGGLLVAIMSAGTEFRENRKAEAFRKLMDEHKASWSDLPAGTFAEAGTMVNALILRVRKP